MLVCGFGTGWGFSLLMIWWETALAQHIPPHLLSRVSAYDWMGSLALLPLGFVLAGPLASALGAQTVLELGSVAGLVLLLLALLPRSTRELTGAPLGPDEARSEPRLAHLPGHPEGGELVAGRVAGRLARTGCRSRGSRLLRRSATGFRPKPQTGAES